MNNQRTEQYGLRENGQEPTLAEMMDSDILRPILKHAYDLEDWQVGTKDSIVEMCQRLWALGCR